LFAKIVGVTGNYCKLHFAYSSLSAVSLYVLLPFILVASSFDVFPRCLAASVPCRLVAFLEALLPYSFRFQHIAVFAFAFLLSAICLGASVPCRLVAFLLSPYSVTLLHATPSRPY
jgi:hypothetical protein